MKRNDAIRARYKALYDTQRVRLDDCIALLASEFFVSEKTVWRVLRA